MCILWIHNLKTHTRKMEGTESKRKILYSRCDKNYGVVGCNRIIVINLEFVMYLFNAQVRTESLQCAIVVKLKPVFNVLNTTALNASSATYICTLHRKLFMNTFYSNKINHSEILTKHKHIYIYQCMHSSIDTSSEYQFNRMTTAIGLVNVSFKS